MLFTPDLSHVHTGDYSRRRRIRRQFVVFGDNRRFWRQSPNSATIDASVDRALSYSKIRFSTKLLVAQVGDNLRTLRTFSGRNLHLILSEIKVD